MAKIHYEADLDLIRARKVAKGQGFETAEPLVMLTAYTMRMAQLLDPRWLVEIELEAVLA